MFDEIEKASPDVLNILLQILEDGQLTDSNGRTVDFKNTIIVMTSNVGAKYIQKTTTLGFQTTDESDANYAHIKAKLQDEISKEFKPEFINRIDDVVIFRSFRRKIIVKNHKNLVDDLCDRLKEKNIRVNQDVIKHITKNGTNTRMGARPLRRSLLENLEDPMADALLRKNTKSDLSITCKLVKDKVSFGIRKLKPKSQEDNPLASKELINVAL